MYFWLFLTKPVEVNENLRGWEAPEGGRIKHPTPDKSSKSNTSLTECAVNQAIVSSYRHVVEAVV